MLIASECNQQETIMKKLFLTAATLVMLSTASFADQNSENANRMEELRRQFFTMTDQMLTDQMSMLKMQETMLTAYQRLLRQMMQNENSSNNN
jgi:predicted site-specific integrase-resolvase